MSKIINLAKELANAIQAIEGGECAVFDASPELEMRSMRSRQLIVSPESYAPVRVARDVVLADAVFSVALIQQTTKGIEELLTLEERIADSLLDAAIGTAKVVSVEFSPPYDADRLRKENIFLGVLMVTLKEISR